MFKFGQLQKEITKIRTYVKNVALGVPMEKPQLKDENAIELFEILLAVIHNDKQTNQSLQQLILQSSNLSDFDVNITNISNKLQDYSERLAQASESNMTVVEETTASLSEMNNAIKNNTEKTVTLSSDAEDLMNSNETNQLHIQEVNELKDAVIQNSEEMRQEINRLRDVSLQVDDIVEGVGEFAEQTNLLALNASIEAARAGENGRGFAIVADEIRKLAEDTKERLKYMQSFTMQIRGANQKSLETVQSTLASMKEMADKIVLLGGSYESSMNNLYRVSDGASELAALMQEITAASTEITRAMEQSASGSEQVSQLSEEVMFDAREMAEIATNISLIDGEIANVNRQLMNSVNHSFEKIKNMEFMNYIKDAVQAHQNWLQKFRQMVEQKMIIPLQADGQKCRFGHFYHIVEVKHPKIQTEWEAIDSIHNDLHRQVHVVTEQIKNNDSAAQQTLQYTEKLSGKIIELMETIIRRTEQLDKNGESVF